MPPDRIGGFKGRAESGLTMISSRFAGVKTSDIDNGLIVLFSASIVNCSE